MPRTTKSATRTAGAGSAGEAQPLASVAEPPASCPPVAVLVDLADLATGLSDDTQPAVLVDEQEMAVRRILACVRPPHSRLASFRSAHPRTTLSHVWAQATEACSQQEPSMHSSDDEDSQPTQLTPQLPQQLLPPPPPTPPALNLSAPGVARAATPAAENSSDDEEMTVREICVRHRAKQHAAVLLDENGVELVTQPSQPPQPPSTPPSPHITSRKRGRRHAVVDDDDDDDDAPAAEVATSVPAAAAAPESGQQYAKLRYTPPTDGERCGEWEGMTVNGVVHAVYRKAFKGTHTQRCADAPGQWIKLPPGNARGDTEPLGSADGCLLPAANRNAPAVFGCSVREAPEVVHRQGREHSCVFSSAASAITFAGHAEAARVVTTRISASLAHANPMALLHDTIKSKAVPTLEVERFYKRGKFDPEIDISSHPTIVQLMGKDGGVGHAVTIVGRWIFDASLPHALLLSRESLDECCSSARGRVPYDRVECAVRVRPHLA